jgi:hypothetical protein
MSSDVTSTEARKQMTAKLVKAMGNKRYCTTCQTDQPDVGGTLTKYRWICQFCAARRKK